MYANHFLMGVIKCKPYALVLSRLLGASALLLAVGFPLSSKYVQDQGASQGFQDCRVNLNSKMLPDHDLLSS